MILKFLRLFSQFRELESRIAARWDNEHSALRAEIRTLEAQLAGAKYGEDLWRTRWESDDKQWRADSAAMLRRNDELTRDLTEKLATAGDALALRLTGRRLFSKAPVEAPPAQDRPPINVSPGASKQFAGDVARRKTASLFERLAKQSGVIAEDANETGEQKPN